MANFIVKKSEAKLDKYPEQGMAEYKGLRKWEQIKDDVGPGRTFESEGDKRDYLRKVKSNPANVPGIPPWLPAEDIRVSYHLSDLEREQISEAPCGHDWVFIRIENDTNRLVYRCQEGHESYTTKSKGKNET